VMLIPAAGFIEAAVDGMKTADLTIAKAHCLKELHVSNADPSHSQEFAEGYFLGLRTAAVITETGGKL
jgi:hypothetical protein